MKINLIIVDECNTEFIAETIDNRQQEAMGELLEGFIEYRLHELRAIYPEAIAIYREDEKTFGEMMSDRYAEAYEYWLTYAEEHPEEVDNWDPEEWADEQARGEVESEWGLW